MVKVLHNPGSKRENYADLTRRACRKDENSRPLDEPARSDVANRAIPIAWSYISERVHIHEDAEDLTLKTAMTAVDKACAYDPSKGSESTWVCALANGHVRNYFRAKRATPKILELEGQSPTTVEMKPSNDETTREQRVAFVQELIRLAEGRQQWLPTVIKLKFWNCLTFEDIADVLELPAGTVKASWNRFKQAMKEELGGISDPSKTLTH